VVGRPKDDPGGRRLHLAIHFRTAVKWLSGATRPFELRNEDRRFLSCGLGFEGWNVTFVDRSVTVQAFVGLGPRARKSDAAELLDRLAIRRSSPSLART
jgi:hypothetical protein